MLVSLVRIDTRTCISLISRNILNNVYSDNKTTITIPQFLVSKFKVVR